MKRIQCSPSAPKIECVDKMSLYAVRWDYRSEVVDEEVIHTCMQEMYPAKPTLAQIKATIYTWFNEVAKDAIMGTFLWRGVQLWLSTENQSNYAAAYSMLQAGVQLLPITLRGGSDEEPVYLTIETKAEFDEFWQSARRHIDTIRQSTWDAKAAFDFSDYTE